jgi:hypothetical protein
LADAAFAVVLGSAHLCRPAAAHRAIDLNLPTLPRGSIERQARTIQASSVTRLPDLVAASNSQRKQTRVVIPALAIQLAVLGVVVLAFVCAAATEARRPEVALARLRGQRSGGAAALLLRELGLLIVIGSVVGGLVGWLVAKFASARWLAPGVTLQLRWPVFAAIAAASGGLLAVVVTGAPTLRQPLVSLLRRVHPRASALRVGLVEGALVAAAVAGEVTLLTTGRISSGGITVARRVLLLAPDCSPLPAASCSPRRSCRPPAVGTPSASQGPRRKRACGHSSGATTGVAEVDRDHHRRLRAAGVRR